MPGDCGGQKRAAPRRQGAYFEPDRLLALAVYVDHIDAKHGAKDDARTPRSNGCFFSGVDAVRPKVVLNVR